VAAPVLVGNERAYVLDCLGSTWVSFTGSKQIERFEAALADFCSTQHAISGCVPLGVKSASLGVHALKMTSTVAVQSTISESPTLLGISPQAACWGNGVGISSRWCQPSVLSWDRGRGGAAPPAHPQERVGRQDSFLLGRPAPRAAWTWPKKAQR